MEQKNITRKLYECVESNNLDELVLLNYNNDLPDNLFPLAVKYGNLQMMIWLYNNKCPIDFWSFRMACAIGNLEKLNWLISINCECDRFCYTYAIDYDKYCFLNQIDSNYYDIIELLINYNCPFDNYIINEMERYLSSTEDDLEYWIKYQPEKQRIINTLNIRIDKLKKYIHIMNQNSSCVIK